MIRDATLRIAPHHEAHGTEVLILRSAARRVSKDEDVGE
jgi:hypothetical protein